MIQVMGKETEAEAVIADMQATFNDIRFAPSTTAIMALEALPEELRQTAELCLIEPPLSLREFSEQLVPPVTRSGVNHRLARLTALYREALQQEASDGERRQA